MKAREAMALLAASACVACGGDSETVEPNGATAPAPGPAVTESAAPASNAPPRILRITFDPVDFMPGDRVTAKVDVEDPDGDPVSLSYRWSLNGQRTGDGTPAVQLSDRSVEATLELDVVADDGRGGISRRSTRATAGNRPPQVTSVSLAPGYEVRASDTLRVSFRGSDPDGDPVSFSHTWFVNDERLDVYTPTLDGSDFRRGDEITLEVVASDGKTESEPLTTKTVRVINTPPVITSSPAGFEESGAFDYQVEVDDADGDRRMRFAILEGPPGMTIDWLNGRIQWSPEAQQQGRHDVELQVDDQNGGVVTQTFAIEVGAEEESTPAAQAP